MIEIYNQNTEKIDRYEKGKTVLIDGANIYIERTTKEILASAGLYFVKYMPTPDRKYYTFTKTGSIVDGFYVVDYQKTEKPIEHIKDLMINDLRKQIARKEESIEIDSTMGFFVKADHKTLKDLEIRSKKNKNTIKDKNGEKKTVSKIDIDNIIEMIEDEMLRISDVEADIQEQILLLGTVDECIAFRYTL